MSIADPHALLLAAPPTGPATWHEVSRRLAHHGWATTAVDLFDEAGSAAALRGGTAAMVDRLRAQASGKVIVAHGLAVPLALKLASATEPVALVLSNGPLGKLDPITAASSRAARRLPYLTAAALRPTALRGWLASSVGMRRLVVNPYVMDRDMVVRVTEGWTSESNRRRAVARWLGELADETAHTEPPSCPTLLIWADEDNLYPAHVADSATSWMPNSTHLRIPGARHLHPIERPWELADLVASQLSGRSEAHAAATQMS